MINKLKCIEIFFKKNDMCINDEQDSKCYLDKMFSVPSVTKD